VQDHARGLLSGDKVNRKLFDLFTASLGFQQTLQLLLQSTNDINQQSGEVAQFEGKRKEYQERMAELDAMLDTARKAKDWEILLDDLEVRAVA
jgi:hypothetical protein